LRRWEDAAKIDGLDVPDVEHYRVLLTSPVAVHEPRENHEGREDREEREGRGKRES
jgi:hypothetical protein